MNPTNIQVRRATLEDLPKLIALWQQENLPWESLEKRFTEFQLAEDVNAESLGTIGLHVCGKEGKLHTEVITHFEAADELRAKILERFQTLAHNRGLVRLWTQLDAPFWAHNGFHEAMPDGLSKLPQAFVENSSPWRIMVLKDEKVIALTVEKEFEVFKEAEKERTEKLLRQARVIKMLAIMLVILVAGIVVLWAVFAAKFKIFQR